MKIQLENIQTDNKSSFRLLHDPKLNDLFFWHFHPEYELVYIEGADSAAARRRSRQEARSRPGHPSPRGRLSVFCVYSYTTVWTSKEIYNKPLISVAQPFS